MKKITRFLVLALSLIMLTSVFACTKKDGDDDEQESTETEIEYTSNYLVKNHRSDYVIVFNADGDYFDNFAVSELQTLFKQATGVQLKAYSDTNTSISYSDTAKYISIGDTTLLEQAGLTYDFDELLESGRQLTVKGNSLFIYGGPFGLVRGVYDFLNRQFNYEFFYKDEIYIDETDEDVKLAKFDDKNIPSINISCPTYDEAAGVGGDREYCLRTYNIHIDDAILPNEKQGGGTWHNILGMFNPSKEDTHCTPILQAYLEENGVEAFKTKYGENLYNILTTTGYVTLGDMHPTWYSNGQLAYSAQESRDEMINYCFECWKNIILKYVDKNGSAAYLSGGHEVCFSFTPMDTGTWSATDESKASLAKYGVESAEYVIFVNEVARLFNPWMEENYPNVHMKVLIFAYQAGTNAAVKRDADGNAIKDANGNYIPFDEDVMLEENITLMYAPIRQSFYHAFTEEENEQYMDIYEQWEALMEPGAEGYFWLYACNFEQSVVPLDNQQAMYTDYQYAAEHNITFILWEAGASEGCRGDWSRLNIYLAGKCSENAYLDLDAETQKFMDHYFKAASPAMTKLHDEYRAWFANLATTTSLDFFYLTENVQATGENYPYGLLVQWLGYIDEAYEAIEYLKEEDYTTYVKLKNRINLESISYRYLILKNFSARIDDKTTYVYDLINDCVALGWKTLTGGSTTTADYLKTFLD